jgi:hypothetical protein
MLITRLGDDDFENPRVRILSGGDFVDRAVGEGASVFHGPSRIPGVGFEVGLVAVKRSGFRSCRELADVKLTALVLDGFAVGEGIQACCAGRSDGKYELRLGTSLVGRANSRPAE